MIETILRHEAQLRQVSAQIRQANSIIDSAKKGADAAAEQLAANWEGDARDAFVATTSACGSAFPTSSDAQIMIRLAINVTLSPAYSIRAR